FLVCCEIPNSGTYSNVPRVTDTHKQGIALGAGAQTDEPGCLDGSISAAGASGGGIQIADRGFGRLAGINDKGPAIRGKSHCAGPLFHLPDIPDGGDVQAVNIVILVIEE